MVTVNIIGKLGNENFGKVGNRKKEVRRPGKIAR
jgi:hypothetical protein